MKNKFIRKLKLIWFVIKYKGHALKITPLLTTQEEIEESKKEDNRDKFHAQYFRNEIDGIKKRLDLAEQIISTNYEFLCNKIYGAMSSIDILNHEIILENIGEKHQYAQQIPVGKLYKDKNQMGKPNEKQEEDVKND
jgi:hypothetical protein